MNWQAKTLKEMTEPELREYFGNLATMLTFYLPPGPSKHNTALFALLVFDESLIAQYVSNADRQDIIKALRACADRLERNEDIPR